MDQAVYPSSFTAEWAKLELGSIATPFVPPDPATELTKCQRYYIGSPLIGTPITKQGNTLVFLFPIPTTMRINPSLLVSEWVLFDSENNNVISTIDWVVGFSGGHCSNGVIVGVVPPDNVEVGSVHEYELQISGGGFDAEIY